MTIRAFQLKVASRPRRAIIGVVLAITRLDRDIETPTPMVTKRQLGIFVISLSIFGLLGLVAVDLLHAGRWNGIGPLQRIGFGLGFGAIIVGLILVRLGNRPA